MQTTSPCSFLNRELRGDYDSHFIEPFGVSHGLIRDGRR